MTGEDERRPPTGLILTGDVAALRREVAVLRRVVLRMSARETRLQAALQGARLPHHVTCPAYSDVSLPCGCGVAIHNARIAAVLEETP